MESLKNVHLSPFFHLENNILTRLEKAYQHAQQYQQLNEVIFPYSDFSITMKELFDIALDHPHATIQSSKVERCFEHMLYQKQENQTYWAFQSFSFTLFEILEVCMKKVNPSAISQIKKDMRNFHKEYQLFSDSMKHNIPDLF